MDISKTAQLARALYDAHGDKAEADAAQKARAHEAAGRKADAEAWRSIRLAIKEIRGAHYT